MSAFSGRFRVATVAMTPIGPTVDGSQYGKGARVTLVPSDVPADNPIYDRDSSVRGELHIGVLNAEVSRRFEIGQVYTLTLDELPAPVVEAAPVVEPEPVVEAPGEVAPEPAPEPVVEPLEPPLVVIDSSEVFP